MPAPLFPGSALLLVVIGYLCLLFGVGWLGERGFGRLRRVGLDRYVYVLAAGVYCTSWTFYGCIGNAARNGPAFLGLFVGPCVFALVWWSFLRKLVLVCRSRHITSLADFLSVRYPGCPAIGPVTTLLLLVAIVPYISLQLQAVSVSFDLIAGRGGRDAIAVEPMLVVSAFMGAFALFFGGRYLDFTRPQGGLLTAVAAESLVKLLIMVGAGIFVTYGLFDGVRDLFGRVEARSDLAALASLAGPSGAGLAQWAAFAAIAVVDVIALPRQFHVLVVQNGHEDHVRTAMWLFPLYLLLINAFVIPIAFGGLLLGLPKEGADAYILAVPMLAGRRALSLLVFLGGFSAATAMVMISSVVLGKMVANNLLIPAALRVRKGFHAYRSLLATARLSILVIVALGYLYARLMSGRMVLMEIGLISFVGVAQFGPPLFGGLYWRRAAGRAALWGVAAGFAGWFYTLVLPALAKAGVVGQGLLLHGPLGLQFLRPTDLLGLGLGDPVANAVLFSLGPNAVAFAVGSLLSPAGAEEAQRAEEIVLGRDTVPGEEGRTRPAGATHYMSLGEVEEVISRYAGNEKEEEVAAVVREIGEIRRQGGTREAVIRQLELPLRVERILTGTIGALAAREVVRAALPLSLADARTLVESYRALERNLETTQREVSQKAGEVRARERFLASVVRSIDDGVVSFDFDGRITTVNEGACRLFRRGEKEMVGKPFDALVRDTPYGEKRRIIARATYRSGHWRGEVEIVRGDGTVAPALLSTAKIIDDEGRPVGFVCSFKDLTEIKAMQHRMLQSEKLASLGQMAAGVAHEIRNPLGSIKMSLGLLRSQAGGGEALQEIDQIREAVASMEVIVNELLDYTREIALRVDDYDVGLIARSAVEALEGERRSRGASIVVEEAAAAKGGLVAAVDGVRLKQVVTNILRNALEACRPGEGRIALRLAEEDGLVRIEVCDNGPGMAPEEVDKVFVPFYTTKAQGVGLGMPIVKRLVELHQGEISIRSRPGEGTTVSVVLPRRPFREAP